MSSRRRRLIGIVARGLIVISIAVIVVNAAIVIYRDAYNRLSLLTDLITREITRLETALLDADGDIARMQAEVGAPYAAHPDILAYAIIDAQGRVVGGANLHLFPAETMDRIAFADDWLAWKAGRGEFPVVASHRVPGVDLTLLAMATDDPGGAIAREILDEFLGHVALPLVPIAILLIGGTLLMVRRALVPVAQAAAWARGVRPGDPLPPFDHEDLPAEIADLTDAVRRSVDRLNEELAAEQRRAGEAAHALRTPVAVLVARLDALPRGLAFDPIRADVQALSRLITQYLSASGADRLEIRPGETAELGAVAEEVVADLWPLATQRGTEIELIAAEGPCTVAGSADAIALALTNLVENAILHGGGAPVAVTVGPGPTLTISDQGPGLPDLPRDAIFEPFRRGPGAERGGAGLGLAIVTRIQRAHGGTVEAANAPGGGAVFTLAYRAA